ncbi:MAG: ammonium transporter, partial [Betaproteobacteria bacterium]|nr:ammonium transporter [Betaproteobacteria bacterium]
GQDGGPMDGLCQEKILVVKLVDLVIGLRVTEEEEREGLDISSHGETAYHS